VPLQENECADEDRIVILGGRLQHRVDVGKRLFDFTTFRALLDRKKAGLWHFCC